MLPAIVALARRHPVHALIRPVDGRDPTPRRDLATLRQQPRAAAVQDEIARLSARLGAPAWTEHC